MKYFKLCATLTLALMLTVSIAAQESPMAHASGDHLLTSTTTTMERISNQDYGLLLEAADPVISAYKQHYDISKVDFTGIFTREDEAGTVWTSFYVELTGCLKYSSAAELPQIQGLARVLGVRGENLSTAELMAQLNSTELVKAFKDDVAQLASATSLRISDQQAKVARMGQATVPDADDLAQTMAQEVFSDAAAFVSDLERNYIGQESTITVGMRIAIDENGEISRVQYKDFDRYVDDVSAVTPISVADMMAAGMEQAQGLATTAAEKMVLDYADSTQSVTRAMTYKRLTARDYANQYTSNAPERWCSVHQQDIAQDTSYYNSAYFSHCCNDCANYVSQAMYAGGVFTDSFWYASKASMPWNGTISIVEHFYEQVNGKVGNPWVLSTAANCNAGGIIMLYDEYGLPYHVMMCVQNDTVNRACSAHTYDVLEQPYNVNSTFGAAGGVQYLVFRNVVDQ